MKATLVTAFAAAWLALGATAAPCLSHEPSDENDMIRPTETWDKTFPLSDKVHHSKVTFRNRYGIVLAADLYLPKDAAGPLPAIAVCGPFGAVKEQVSGLYAQTMAERGFLTLAFDPSSRAKAAANPAAWRRPTSTPRTSRQP